MVRLTHDNGPRADIVDRWFAPDRKRTRTAASSGSLSYMTSGDDLIRPRSETAKDSAAARQQQQQRQQEQQVVSSRGTLTRARANSGIPPKQPPRVPLDLSDLEDLDTEQLLQLLNDHPELMEAVNEHAAEGGRSKFHRESRPARKTEAERLDLLKQEGVPVAQWTAVLFLVLIGIFQLWKIVREPKATGKKAKKRASEVVPMDVDKIVAKIEGPAATADNNKKKPVPAHKKPALKKKKQKSITKNDKAKKEAETAAARSEPTGASSSADIDTSQPLTAPIQTQPLEEPDDAGWQTVGAAAKSNAAVESTATTTESSTATAQSESASKKNGSAPKKEEPVTSSTDPSTDGDAKLAQQLQEEENKRAQAAEPEVAEEPALSVENDDSDKPAKTAAAPSDKKEAKTEAPATSNQKAKAKNSKSKKKNAKLPNGQAPSNGSSAAKKSNGADDETTTDGDAALAQQLQNEENKLADSEASTTAADAKSPAEDSWEEVSTKKKRAKA